jgi:hypothetical protein
LFSLWRGGCGGVEQSVAVDALGERLGMQSPEASEGSRAEEGQLCVHEAQRSVNRDAWSDVGHGRSDERDLLGEPVDELGLVAAGDAELRLAQQGADTVSLPR